ncbi:MAG TPA: DUF6580 family putative transport protein [Sphingobacteriaceae bacterium]|nr:DUF6580 family putative transport protein [Sphingobacteriaceae bacterium]
MIKQLTSSRFLVLTLVIIAVACTRALPYLIPHLWNFSAVYALGIFAGSQFNDRRLAIIMPLAAMALSDLFIGNGFSLIVYAGFIVIVMCGMAIQKRINVTNVALASIAGAFLFYLITNFALFYPPTQYPHNADGIILSYVRGLPFLRNALISDLVFAPILFYGFYMLEKRYPALARN